MKLLPLILTLVFNFACTNKVPKNKSITTQSIPSCGQFSNGAVIYDKEASDFKYCNQGQFKKLPEESFAQRIKPDEVIEEVKLSPEQLEKLKPQELRKEAILALEEQDPSKNLAKENKPNSFRCKKSSGRSKAFQCQGVYLAH